MTCPTGSSPANTLSATVCPMTATEADAFTFAALRNSPRVISYPRTSAKVSEVPNTSVVQTRLMALTGVCRPAPVTTWRASGTRPGSLSAWTSPGVRLAPVPNPRNTPDDELLTGYTVTTSDPSDA